MTLREDQLPRVLKFPRDRFVLPDTKIKDCQRLRRDWDHAQVQSISVLVSMPSLQSYSVNSDIKQVTGWFWNKRKQLLSAMSLQQVAVWSNCQGTERTPADAMGKSFQREFFNSEHQPDQQRYSGGSMWCGAVSVGNGEDAILTSDTVTCLHIVCVNGTLS